MHRQAFTLIELLMVTAICGLLFYLGSGGLFAYQKGLNLKLAAEEVAGKLRLAQHLAATSGENQAVVFEKNYYTLGKNKQALPSGIHCTVKGQTVFAASSFPLVESLKTIVLQNQLGHYHKIIVSNVGRVRIE